MPEPRRNLTVRFDEKTRETLELIAERELRPLANQIVFFVNQGIEAYLKSNDLIVSELLDDNGAVEGFHLEDADSFVP